VLVATAPLAVIGYTKLTGNRYNFRDESLYIPTSRSWNFGDQTGSTLANVSKTYSAAGNVNVCLTVSNAYGSDDTCVALEIFLGIDDIALSNAISVYPTNGNGDLSINLNSQFKGDVSVSVFDLKGQKVFNDIVIKAGTNNAQVNYTSLSSGAYKMRIGNKETGYAVKPILINK
jgi:PKD repeat protein